MYYRFPDEYFFPVESKNDFDFEEVGYRHVIIESAEDDIQSTLSELKNVEEVLNEDIHDTDRRDRLSFEEYLVLEEKKEEEVSIINGTRSVTSFEENLELGSEDEEEREEIEEQTEEATENVEANEVEIEIDKNLTREEPSDHEDRILEESDDEYVEAEIVEEINEANSEMNSEEIQILN